MLSLDVLGTRCKTKPRIPSFVRILFHKGKADTGCRATRFPADEILFLVSMCPFAASFPSRGMEGLSASQLGAFSISWFDPSTLGSGSPPYFVPAGSPR